MKQKYILIIVASFVLLFTNPNEENFYKNLGFTNSFEHNYTNLVVFSLGTLESRHKKHEGFYMNKKNNDRFYRVYIGILGNWFQVFHSEIESEF